MNCLDFIIRKLLNKKVPTEIICYPEKKEFKTLTIKTKHQKYDLTFSKEYYDILNKFLKWYHIGYQHQPNTIIDCGDLTVCVKYDDIQYAHIKTKFR